MRTPENLQVLATHGTAKVPRFLEGYIRRAFNERLRLNFSDYGTGALARKFPERQHLIPAYGRIAGDPARAPDADDAFRQNDFNDIPVYRTHLPVNVMMQALEASHIPYHAEIRRRLLGKHGHPQNKLTVFDVHDTGNFLLGEQPKDDVTRLQKKEWMMPPVIISNLKGKTASPEVMHDLRAALRQYLRLDEHDILENWQFFGGYVTQKYGDPQNPALQEAVHERQVVQIELARSLYMDERTQEVIPHAMEWVATQMKKALVEVADGQMHGSKA